VQNRISFDRTDRELILKHQNAKKEETKQIKEGKSNLKSPGEPRKNPQGRRKTREKGKSTSLPNRGGKKATSPPKEEKKKHWNTKRKKGNYGGNSNE